MNDKLTIQPTSDKTANLAEDIILSNPEEYSSGTTRRILRVQLVDNPNDSDATIRATIMHQRRSPKAESWQDADSFNLTTLKAGQEIRLSLTAGQTRRLYDALSALYQVPVGGWGNIHVQHFAVVPTAEALLVTGREREVIEALLEQEGDQFWDLIQELRPGLLDTIAITNDYEKKTAAVREFRQQFEAAIAGVGSWKEGDWEEFFRNNTWIFGYNLVYQFVRTVADQPLYADPDMYGQDSQRGDVLLATEADARFTVLVDLKRPDTSLVHSKKYRNQVYHLDPQLVGGVSQLQSNARNWENKINKDVQSAIKLDKQRIYTFEPRSILIVGNTASLDNDDKRATFELYRRNLKSPEIITYDELLARAEYAVKIHKEAL